MSGFGGVALSVPLGMEVESHKSHDKDGQHEADDSRDQGSDPFGPTEHVAGFSSFKVPIHFERDHTGLMFQFLHSLEELGSRDVTENSLGIPIPVEDSSVGGGMPNGIFTIDLVIFQL